MTHRRHFTVSKGETVPFVLTWGRPTEDAPRPRSTPTRRMADT